MVRTAAVLLLAIVPAPVSADQVITADANYIETRISGYVDGDLHLHLADGSITVVRLVEAQRVVVDRTGGLADFNEAERYLAGDQPEQAIFRYERALRKATQFWPVVVRVRLLQACNRAGNLEKAVDYFLDVTADAPGVAAELLPRSIPSNATALTRRLERRLESEANRAPDPDRRLVIELFRYWLLHQTDHAKAKAEAADIAITTIPAPIASRRAYAVKEAALRRLLAEGQTDAVLTEADRAMENCPLEVMPDLLLLKGQTLMADTEDRETLLQAAAVLMRVPIHFPDDERAPEALLWAARAHRRLGLNEQAKRLLNECLAHARTTDALRPQAEAELARLEQA